jgi:hypothetical protein
LGLERLEDRIVPSILFGDNPGLTTSDNGGPMLVNGQVRVVFWGNGWSSNSALQTQVQNAIDSLNSSTYFYSSLPGADLSQYRIGSAARPTRVASFNDNYNSPGTTFTANDVFNMLAHEFGSATQFYYFVIPDPNSNFIDGKGDNAVHTFGTVNGSRLYFGTERNLATPSLDDLTDLYSHEMAESITDLDGTALQVNPRNSSSWNEIGDGQAQNYSYRVGGVLAQSYWSQADGKFTVPTGQRQNFYVSSARVLTVNGDQLGSNYNDSITLDVSGSGGVIVNLNGETAQFDPGAISSIVVNTGGGNDTVNIEKSAAGVPITVNLGNGTDTINVAPTSHFLNNIQGNLTLNGGLGVDTLNVFDQNDGGNATYTLTAGSVTRAGTALISYGGVHLINFVNINGGSGNDIYNVNGTESFYATTLDTGSGQDTVNVQATGGSGGTLTVDLGNGTDTINVTPTSRSLNNIQGNLTLNTPFFHGVDTLNVFDQNDGNNDTYTLTAGSVTRTGSALISYGGLFSLFNVVNINGGSGNAIYNVNGTMVGAATTLDTGSGQDTVNVRATGGSSGKLAVNTTTGNGGGGADVVNIGNAGSVQGIAGAVTIFNGPNRDQVTIDDSADGGIRTATISSGGITGLAPAAINFDSNSVSTLLVKGGSGNNTDTVSGTPAFTSVTLDTGGGVDTTNVQTTSLGTTLAVNTTTNPGGGGNDVVNIGNAGSVRSIFGAVTIHNGPSRDQVTIDDSADGGNRTAIISSGGITGLAPAAINFDANSVSTLLVKGGIGNNTYTVSGSPASSVTLDTGGGTDTTNVQATASFATLAVNTTTGSGGGGNDVVNLGNAGSMQGIAGPVTIANTVSRDQVNLDDSADGTNRSVTIGAGGISGLAPAPINFTASSVSTLLVKGGGGTDTYTVTGTPASTSVTLTAGGGNNTLFGPNVNTTWSITGSNAGQLAGSGLLPVNFTGVRNLTGGSAADTFFFSNGAGVTGNIDGGGGANMLDYLPYLTSVTVNLSAGTATGVGGSVANIQQLRGGQSDDTLTGNAAGGTTFLASPGNDTVTGLGSGNFLTHSGAPGTWNVSAQNAGTITFGASTTTFSGVQNLLGSANDTFVFADSVGVDGTIQGGTLDESAYSTPVTVNLVSFTATGVGGNAFLNRYIGSAAGGNTLIGPNFNNTWNITAQNAGNMTQGGISFSGFQNLTGGSAPNTFFLSNGVGVDGNINGGSSGNNQLNESAYTTAVTVDLTANTATGVGGGFTNLQGFVGGSSGGNTLNGPAGTTSWSIIGSNGGSLTGGFSFAAFQNLTGGAGNNTFVIGAGAAVSGTITGGGGTNSLDYSAFTGNVIVDLQTSFATALGGLAGTFTNVHGANGGGAGLYNLLIGAGGNVLTGGTGRRNILVAGGSASTLIGGTQDDLLIGGTTIYDTEVGLTSWQQIAAYWAGTDPFNTRVNNLENGNGVPLLDATTVTGNGGSNTMTGSNELALIYSDGLDTISGFNPSSQTVTISP